MAPGLVDSSQPRSVRDGVIPKSVFPDGLKTSGQHPPEYDDLKPFEEFPEHITGGTVWDAAEYKDNADRWTHRLTRDEVAELGDTADHFKAAGIPLTGISKVRKTRAAH